MQPSVELQKGSLRERKSRPSNESGGTVRGGQGDRTSPAKLQHLPEDRAAEVSLPDVQKDSHHAYETAGLTSFWDYFMLCTLSTTILNSFMLLSGEGNLSQYYLFCFSLHCVEGSFFYVSMCVLVVLKAISGDVQQQVHSTLQSSAA